MQPILLSLQEIVTAMREASDTLRTKVDACAAEQRTSMQPPLERIQAIVRAFESELLLRQTVVTNLTSTAEADDAPAWDERARLLLSAWVLEPYIEHEKLDLFFASVAAEPAVTPRRK